MLSFVALSRLPWSTKASAAPDRVTPKKTKRDSSKSSAAWTATRGDLLAARRNWENAIAIHRDRNDAREAKRLEKLLAAAVM